MGLTSLEAISEKLNESKNLELESILRVSGSSAITKNEYGITIVDAENAASSLIFKNLSKPKYDEVELVKAIDTNVIELKPNIPEPNLNLVPKPLYDTQVELVVDLRKKVEALTNKRRTGKSNRHINKYNNRFFKSNCNLITKVSR